MNELERSIAAYAQFLDEQSLARSSDHTSESEVDEGEVIVIDLQTHEPSTAPTGETPGRKWLPYAILAAAAVLVLVVALALFDTTEDALRIDVVDNQEVDEPTVTTLETVDPVVAENLGVGTAFMDAFVSGDIDEALSYAVEAQTWRVLSGSLPMLRNEREWMTAVDWTVEYDECTVTVADPANTWVACPVVNDTALGRALGLGPYAGEYQFRINKGEHLPGFDLTEPTITAMIDEFPWTTFNDEVMGPFTDWLEANHPDDVERMFRPAEANQPTLPWVTPEVRDLWQQYTLEFVADHENS